MQRQAERTGLHRVLPGTMPGVSCDMSTSLFGWTGQILRADLSSGDLSVVDTRKYSDKYIGGKGLMHRLAWEEIPRGVGAFDPENRLMVTTGPLTGTPAPTSGRTEVGGVAAQCYPEMYSHSGFGGWFGPELKYAGFDAVIVQGKAPSPCYLWINDGKAEIRNAGMLWGMGSYGTQRELEKIHGKGTKSLVIGPAGERQSRIATLLTGASNAAGQGGFGGVAGSKNLKAISVKGTKSIRIAHPDKLLETRSSVSLKPTKNPLKTNSRFEYFSHVIENVPYQSFYTACSHSCDRFCMPAFMDVTQASQPGQISGEMGCIAQLGIGWEVGESWTKQETPLSWPLWRSKLERGMETVRLMNEYGLNQYDILGGMVPWIVMASHEGILSDEDFGFEIEPDEPEWWTKFLKMMAYRQGFGDLLAEGTTRAINTLGKSVFGDTVYTGERKLGEKQMPTPVSLQQGWGYAEHYSGRGLNSSVPFPDWLLSALAWMNQSRDAFNDTHVKSRLDWMNKFRENPYKGETGAWIAIWNENRSEFKCSLILCDYAFPMPYFVNAEAYLFSAVTGQLMTAEEADLIGERLKNLQRAVLVRNYDRNRKMEEAEIIPFFKRPDGSTGATLDETQFKILVDNYYDQRGWNRDTGRPTRAKLEELGLKDVADVLEQSPGTYNVQRSSAIGG
jgi:aldehyde:ferredoxin oxidoreductase